MARLEVITGPMFSGKSEELARRLRRATFANRRIAVIKPSQDDRKTRSIFAIIQEDARLKDYEFLAKQALSHPRELKNFIDAFRPDILAIDEAQFLEANFLEYIEELLEKSKSKNFIVIVAGLDMDAWGRPFGIMPQLMAMADEVLKLTAICSLCLGENGPAIFTQKKGGAGQQIEIGDAKLYEARCRVCHSIPKESSV
jgi:thymidine kinase